ncbi:hypothetical protein [Devosia subaequoris]|uniref:hypothetical protein n=1 Tax=Devosia subaequoris TaxID=395930 RepID=UPI0016178A3E
MAERLGAPATATQMGLGAIPSSHGNFIGHGGVIGGDAVNDALTEADLVLAVGCRFSSWLWDAGAPALASNCKVIQVDRRSRLRTHGSDRLGLAGPAAPNLSRLSGPASENGRYAVRSGHDQSRCFRLCAGRHASRRRAGNL